MSIKEIIPMNDSTFFIHAQTDCEKRNRKPHKILIYLKSGRIIEINGNYCPEYETNRWHYWIKDDGTLLHITKESIEFVEGGTEEDLIESKKIKEIFAKESGFAPNINAIVSSDNPSGHQFRKWLKDLGKYCSLLDGVVSFEDTQEHQAIQKLLEELQNINNNVIQTRTANSPKGLLLKQIVTALYKVWYVSFHESKHMYQWKPYTEEHQQLIYYVNSLIEKYERDYENN